MELVGKGKMLKHEENSIIRIEHHVMVSLRIYAQRWEQ